MSSPHIENPKLKDLDDINSEFEEAERTKRPVVCLMGAEWSWN